MEVPHSTHHSGKKGFKEYLQEGLMIFLAVLLGFFAENLRENIGERAKEKEYIAGLIQNLKDDTTNLTITVKENRQKIAGLGKLISLAGREMVSAASRKLLYEYSRNKSIGFYSMFKSNDVTLQQLKNSGGLRYIRKQEVANRIARYDIEMHAIYAAATVYSNTIDASVLSSQEILDNTIFYDSTYFVNGAFTNKPLPLLNSDPVKLKIFFNKIDNEIGFTQNYLDNLSQRLPYVISLIKYLQKEYHLENE